MAMNADTLLDRINLKNQIRRWRIFAFIALALMVVALGHRYSPMQDEGRDYIARYTLEGFIGDDHDREALFKRLTTDKKIKAVIIRIDSPGGSSVAGEQLFTDIRRLSEKKPTVAVMRNMATSAAYMAAVSTDYVIASHGTITGSVGAMVQTVEVTELAKKLGINPISVTTGDLKGRPSPIVPYDMRDEEMLEALLDDYLDYFLGLVKERRKLSEESIAFIRDGRVVNGMRAVELGLVDTLGDEQTALDWLKKERKIDEKLKIKDVEPESDEKNLFDYLSESAQTSLTQSLYRQSGLMAYHKPVQPLQ